MDEQSLHRLEFARVTESVSALAESAGGAAWLSAMRPLADAHARAEENGLLAEAIRRHREPGEWCQVGRGELGVALEDQREGVAGGLDGPRLVQVLGWLDAAEATRHAWAGSDAAERHPRLAAKAQGLPVLEPLRKRLSAALEPDGRVSDAASPALKRARAELAGGERALQQQLERWARPYGEGSYVTRHGDRFVALIPAAGFPRRRGIVHDVSGSGQSLFVEPLEACEANNHLIELRAAVLDEERRVLAELAGLVLDASAALESLERTLLHLDTLRARARWAAEHGGIAIEPRGDRLKLARARHPLLAIGTQRERVVPLDLELARPGSLLLVSGPNMGGKTVLLKTVGLTVALSHAGFPVLAAEGSTVPEIDEMLVDVGDEQSVDRGLSTFAAHLSSLAAMAKRAGPRTLVLCDELGAGTDPEEGGSLGRALIEHFAARGTWAVITTHLGSLKRVAGDVPGVVNGSLEFDAPSMTPCFRFLPGVPGASHAVAIAERLGLDPAIVARARALTPEETGALERLIAELQVARRQMDHEVESLAAARAAAEAAAVENRAATEDARRTLADLRRRLTRESEAVLSHVRELWQTVQREARRSEKTRAGAAEMRGRMEAAEREVEALDRAVEGASAGFGVEADQRGNRNGFDARSLRAGTRVRVVDLGVEAELVSEPDAEGKVMLRRGSWSINTHVNRLAPAQGEPPGAASRGGPEGRASQPASPGGAGAAWEAPDPTPALDIDLRGMEVDQALRTLDEGLDRGVLSGLSELRIIHGVGRGILRAAVERHLRRHPQVAGQRLGQLGEGGRGVTVATLR